jgi:hypothetical protein
MVLGNVLPCSSIFKELGEIPFRDHQIQHVWAIGLFHKLVLMTSIWETGMSGRRRVSKRAFAQHVRLNF